MKKPNIDFDRSWAEADWPSPPEWYTTKKAKLKTDTKKATINAVKTGAKKIATSKKLRDKLTEFGTSYKIADNTYRLSADYVFQSYLFIGKHKALLVDTGLGIGNTLDKVRELTDKPLIVVCTHGHFGVIGGAGQFDEVKVSKDDLKLAKNFYKIVGQICKYAGKDSDLNANFVALTKSELEHGFDLGGRTIKIVATPSHTRGSICFIDESNKLAIVGDVVAPLGIQLLPTALPLNKYIETMEELLKSLEGKKVYCSYFPRALDYDYASEFKSQLYLATCYGNDFHSPVKFRRSTSKKLLLIYYGPKANKRSRETRWNAIKGKGYN